MPERVEDKQKVLTKKVSKLLLDDQNFRFPEDARGTNQIELLKIIDQKFDPLTIGESLVDNGYFFEEPLVVIPKPKSDKYIVVEGNRRLTALKFLLEEDLRSISRNPEAWKILASRLKVDLTEVPVVKYESRDDLTTVLGYRHIAGIMKWQPLPKARFIHNFVEMRGKASDFAEIAREIGSKGPHIRDQYIIYRTYIQAKDLRIDTSRLENNYAVFYRALTGTRKIAQFIGLSKEGSPQRLKRPVPSNKIDNLEELIGYLHGTNKKRPAIRESREVNDLGEVLASKPALEILRLTGNLQRALELVGGEVHRIIENLKSASFYLDEAVKDAHRQSKNPDVLSLVRRCLRTMAQIVEHFPDAKKDLESNK